MHSVPNASRYTQTHYSRKAHFQVRESIDGGEVVGEFLIGEKTRCLARIVRLERGTFADVRLFVVRRDGSITRTGRGLCVHPVYLTELRDLITDLAEVFAELDAETDG
jgi:hypothetical protein